MFVAAATAATYDKEGLLNGKWLINFIRSQQVKEFVSDRLYEVITSNLEEAEGKDNVREHVKIPSLDSL